MFRELIASRATGVTLTSTAAGERLDDFAPVAAM